MKRTISAVEARQKLGEVLEGVHYRGDEVVIERAGKPMAVVIPARLYDGILKRRERVKELTAKAQERHDMSEDEAMQYAVEAVREVRREREAEEREQARPRQAS